MTQYVGSNYLLGERIGSGATGRVWKARTRSGESVAVKVLRSELAEDEKVVSRFVQERSLLSKLDHVNLIGVRDLVVEGPVLAIVMDLATGPDLRQELTHRGTLPPAEAVGVTAEVLSGLACVHAAGVVHRDVKPENVVLDQPEGQPRRARLTDFGVSRLLDTTGSSSRTSHTALVGTPSYMAPEQAQPGPVPPAADVYAAGCVLYELLCGVPPFTGSPLELIRQHGERQPGRIPGISDGLWGCLAVLLHKDPAHRPSAEQAAADLRALVPVLLGQPALPPRTEPPLAAGTAARETVHVASRGGLGSSGRDPTPPQPWSGSPVAGASRGGLLRRPAVIAAVVLLVVVAAVVGGLTLVGGSKGTAGSTVETTVPTQSRALVSPPAPPSSAPSTPGAPLPAPAPPPPTPSAAASGVFWTAAVLSSHDEQNAQEMVTRLSQKGFDGEYWWSTADNSTLPGYWVVTSGHFPDQTEAVTRARLLQPSGFDGAYARCVGSRQVCASDVN